VETKEPSKFHISFIAITGKFGFIIDEETFSKNRTMSEVVSYSFKFFISEKAK
jgi:hypothetical protein